MIPGNGNKQGPGLYRVLGISSSILLVMGIMIGSGIFKKIAPMAASGLNSQYIIAAWVVAGVITMLGALTVSGLAAISTESGGEYEYLRIIFGNFTAFLFGWASFTIIGSASIAALSYIFTQSIHQLFPLGDPLKNWEHVSIGGAVYPFAYSGIKLVSLSVIVLLTWVNYRGTKAGASLNNLLTWVKIAGILMVIVYGLSYTGSTDGNIQATDEILPVNKTGLPLASAFFAAMLSAFWAYDGWLNISFMAGEIKNPLVNLPRSIVMGVLLVMLLYVLINLAFLHVLSPAQLKAMDENDIAAAVMMQQVAGGMGNRIISILILFSTFGALNGLIITYARLYYKMAADGNFFSRAARIHPRYHTPHIALLASMLMSCLLLFSGSFDTLTDMIIFAGFLFYALLAYGLMKLKRAGKISKLPWGYPWAAYLFILFSLGLLANTLITQPGQTATGVLLMLTGVPVYYLLWFKKGQPGQQGPGN